MVNNIIDINYLKFVIYKDYLNEYIIIKNV